MTPLDTSMLGPVRVDNGTDAIKAQVVRDAILEIANSARDPRVLKAGMTFVTHASDAEMKRLGRMLK